MKLSLCRWFRAFGRLICFVSSFFSLLAAMTPPSSLQLKVACTWLAGVNGGGCRLWRWEWRSCKAVPIIFHSESFLCDFCWPHAVRVHGSNDGRLRQLKVVRDSSANNSWVEMFSYSVYVSNEGPSACDYKVMFLQQQQQQQQKILDLCKLACTHVYS